MISLDTMRVFTALVEEASFTGAAARLGRTQSGVSQNIARLEQALGVQLVERGTRGAVPTPAGRRMYARALAMLREVAAIETELSGLGAGSAGTVRIGLMPALTRSIAGPVLRDYLVENPNASVHLVERPAADLIAEIVADRLHAAVVPAFDAPDSMRCRSLGRTAEVLAMRASEAHLIPVAPATLGPLRLVLQSGGHIRRQRALAQLRAQGVEIEALMDLDSMFATLEFIAHSEFVTVLPAIMLAPEIDSAALCVRPMTDDPLMLDLMLVESARREPSEMVNALAGRIEAAVQAFNADLAARVRAAIARHR